MYIFFDWKEEKLLLKLTHLSPVHVCQSPKARVLHFFFSCFVCWFVFCKICNVSFVVHSSPPPQMPYFRARSHFAYNENRECAWTKNVIIDYKLRASLKTILDLNLDILTKPNLICKIKCHLCENMICAKILNVFKCSYNVKLNKKTKKNNVKLVYYNSTTVVLPHKRPHFPIFEMHDIVLF